MVLTNEMNLPAEEELTVPEINLSSPALRAGAFHMGKHCEKENNVNKYDCRTILYNFFFFFNSCF